MGGAQLQNEMEGLTADFIAANIDRGRLGRPLDEGATPKEERTVSVAFRFKNNNNVAQFFLAAGAAIACVFPAAHQLRYQADFFEFDDTYDRPTAWPREECKGLVLHITNMTMRQMRMRRIACQQSCIIVYACLPLPEWRDLRVLLARMLWESRQSAEWDL